MTWHRSTNAEHSLDVCFAKVRWIANKCTNVAS